MSSDDSIVRDPFGELLVDLGVLERASQEDFSLGFWSGYEDRRRDFNELLERAQALGLEMPLQPLAEVPMRERAHSGAGSPAERAKLREVSVAASRLVQHVQRRVGSDAIPGDGRDVATLEHVERLCNRFHAISRQLRSRHAERPTLDVGDEYDVQDLFHALLRIHFEDIRPEEFTPSYAGGGSRTDFLLKSEKCVIEIKKTRASLKARELGEELIIDIARYATHPDCKLLVCFTYDPEGRISNPRGLETDLEKRGTAELRVRVLIRPTEL